MHENVRIFQCGIGGIVGLNSRMDVRRSRDLVRGLYEATLPLDKGVAKKASVSYGALLVVMDPMDFIRLTTPDEAGAQKILDTVDVSLADYRAGKNPDYSPQQYNIPFLNVVWPTGKVKGHEGRHRAARVVKAGGRNFPVALYFYSETEHVVSYTIEPDDEEPRQESQAFKSFKAAEAFEKELQAKRQELDHPWVSNIKIETYGGWLLKGHPVRGANFEPWDPPASWQASDMPAQLIGQFNPSIVVPASRMRVGVLKRPWARR